MTGGGGSQPQPPSVQQSAQAQAEGQIAGQMFEAANAPVLGYENAVTSALINPYTSALQSSLYNQSALKAASANQAIQAETNPRAYQAQQMALQGANNRVGSLYGMNPASFTYRDPSAFQTPNPAMLPNLSDISNFSRAIGANITGVNIDKNGNVTYRQPQNFTDINTRGLPDINPASIVPNGWSSSWGPVSWQT